MELSCQGCAGCCIDWTPLAPQITRPERTGPQSPLDAIDNFVPLRGEEVRSYIAAGHGGALVPRLWTVTEDSDTSPATVEIDGYQLAAVADRPVFYVGLRKVPKPVAPFDHERTWLRTCVFLDPSTLQCRIHDTEFYPAACAAYPGHNLLLDQETECERVERATGDQRLLDPTPPDDIDAPAVGPQALGARLFAHPDPEMLSGTVDRIASGTATPSDWRSFIAVAAGSSPGTLAINDPWRTTAREQLRQTESWVDQLLAYWSERAGAIGTPTDDVQLTPETRDPPPEVPGWDTTAE